MPAHSTLPRKLPRDLQEAMLKREKPGATIHCRSRKTISIPPWCPLTHHILEGGIWTADYQNALDGYCIQRLEVANPEWRWRLWPILCHSPDSTWCVLLGSLPFCAAPPAH